MSNDLVPVDLTQLPAGPGTDLDDEMFKDMTKGANFLRRIQLVGKGKFVDTGKIKPGRYGIPNGDEITDLGDRIDLLAFAWRAKVIDMSDEPIFTSFDVTDPRFQEIRELADQKDTQCQYGPSFLVYERTTQSFYELFLGPKTHRTEGRKILPFLPVTQAEIDAKNERRKARNLPPVDDKPHGALPFTLTSQFIKKKFSWWVPVTLECSSPFTTLPSEEDYKKEMARFKQSEQPTEDADAEAPKKPSRKR